MVEVATRRKPLWFKVIFELPELIKELLLKGVLPKTRKTIIDLSTKILIYCGKRRKKLNTYVKWLENTTLLVIEWINNNWKKKLL